MSTLIIYRVFSREKKQPAPVTPPAN
jgi:hypothetical protein